eukprot:3079788-Amphidinium_carterae.1
MAQFEATSLNIGLSEVVITDFLEVSRLGSSVHGGIWKESQDPGCQLRCMTHATCLPWNTSILPSYVLRTSAHVHCEHFMSVNVTWPFALHFFGSHPNTSSTTTALAIEWPSSDPLNGLDVLAFRL